MININSRHYVSRILLDEFERLGLTRSLEELTIKEINELSKRLIERINKEESQDEPPF